MDEHRLTRAKVIRGGVALAAGGAALAAWPRDTHSARSAKQDAAILKFALVVEDLQAAFYADALDKGALKGEDHGLRSADYPTERAERRMDQEGGDLARVQPVRASLMAMAS